MHSYPTTRTMLHVLILSFSLPGWMAGMVLSQDVRLDAESSTVLTLPQVAEGAPAPGKRVRQRADEYAETDVHHTVYLPKHWSAEGQQLPIIFEYTGNHYPAAGSTGKVADAGLGYGLSGGKFIWVVLPMISADGQSNAITWWGDIDATVAYAKTNVPRIIQQFHANPNAVYLCGFSRGAIGVNFLGLHDNDIARLWTGFITHDHFDGVRAWRGTDWGSPLETYRQRASERLKRVAGRPYLVCESDDIEPTRRFVQAVLGKENTITFLKVDTQAIFGKFPNDVAKHPHTDRWLLLPSKYRTQAWEWMNQTGVAR